VNIDQENVKTMKSTIKMQGVKKGLERKIINSIGWQITEDELGYVIKGSK